MFTSSHIVMYIGFVLIVIVLAFILWEYYVDHKVKTKAKPYFQLYSPLSPEADSWDDACVEFEFDRLTGYMNIFAFDKFNELVWEAQVGSKLGEIFQDIIRKGRLSNINSENNTGNVVIYFPPLKLFWETYAFSSDDQKVTIPWNSCRLEYYENTELIVKEMIPLPLALALNKYVSDSKHKLSRYTQTDTIIWTGDHE